MQLLRRTFTIAEFHQMAEIGILGEKERVELIRGEIIEMGKIGKQHAALVKRLNWLFAKQFGDRVLISVQDPIELSDNSEPQPDIVLLRFHDDFYASGHPKPQDVFLVVEVSDTTLKYDREVKVPLYAETGIQEVWVLDLNAACLCVYRQPSPTGYGSIETYTKEQAITMLAFPEVAITVTDLLG